MLQRIFVVLLLLPNVVKIGSEKTSIGVEKSLAGRRRKLFTDDIRVTQVCVCVWVSL